MNCLSDLGVDYTNGVQKYIDEIEVNISVFNKFTVDLQEDITSWSYQDIFYRHVTSIREIPIFIIVYHE